MADAETIHLDQFLPHAPATVWRAITDPERVAKWWATGDVRPEVGHRFTLDMGGFGEVPCTVTAVEPEALLAYTLAEDQTEWVITWRLEPEGSGTRLFLEHAGFDLDNPRDQRAFRNMSRGWESTVLPRLADLLATV